MKGNYINKSILLTGATGGLGSAIIRRFLSSDYTLALTDVNDHSSLKLQIEESDYAFRKCDLRKREEVAELYEFAKQAIGIPDVLILTAGVGIKEKLSEGDPEKWQYVMDVNVMGNLRCIRAFLPEMLKRKSGHIIFISSVASAQPHAYGAVYTASKTALDIIAETLRLETHPYLHISTISPGYINTDFFKHQLAGYSNGPPNYQIIEPDEIAEDVFYILNTGKHRTINKLITRPLAQEF